MIRIVKFLAITAALLASAPAAAQGHEHGQGARHHVTTHVAMAPAAVNGRAVLTAEQRTRLHGAMGSMMPMMQQMMRDQGYPGMGGMGTGGAQPAHPGSRAPSGRR